MGFEGGDVDVSDFGRENYDAQAPLQDGTDGAYEESYAPDSLPKTPVTDGTHPTAPLTDDTYSDPTTGSHPTAPLTDETYSETKTAPQTVDPYGEDAEPVKLTAETYTGDTADLTGGEVKTSENY